jgi:hypothetical protein
VKGGRRAVGEKEKKGRSRRGIREAVKGKEEGRRWVRRRRRRRKGGEG